MAGESPPPLPPIPPSAQSAAPPSLRSTSPTMAKLTPSLEQQIGEELPAAGDVLGDPQLQVGGEPKMSSEIHGKLPKKIRKKPMERAIHTNAEIMALHNYHGLILVVKLVSLADLETAPEMYQELHTLLITRGWVCPKLTILEGFFWMARAIQGLRNTLEQLQPAVNQNVALHGPNSVLHTFVAMRHLAIQLDNSRTNFKYRVGVLSDRVTNLAKLINGLSQKVLENGMTIAELQACIPGLLILIDETLNAAMQF